MLLKFPAYFPFILYYLSTYTYAYTYNYTVAFIYILYHICLPACTTVVDFLRLASGGFRFDTNELLEVILYAFLSNHYEVLRLFPAVQHFHEDCSPRFEHRLRNLQGHEMKFDKTHAVNVRDARVVAGHIAEHKV